MTGAGPMGVTISYLIGAVVLLLLAVHFVQVARRPKEWDRWGREALGAAAFFFAVSAITRVLVVVEVLSSEANRLVNSYALLICALLVLESAVLKRKVGNL